MNVTKCMPDYDNCIIGIPSSILAHYGITPMHRTLPDIDAVLKSRKYKKVVMMVLDGMGMAVMDKNLPADAFMIRHRLGDISSVFPCTTPVATTSLYSGQCPREHGWMGWQMYFPEYDKYIELFREIDFYTKESVDNSYLDTIKYTSIVERLRVDKDINCIEIFSYNARPDLNGPRTLPEFFEHISDVCSGGDEHMVVAYWTDPDHLMHRHGTTADVVRNVMMDLDTGVKNLATALTDTLLIITADHGHIDITETVLLNDYPDIMGCLRRLPSLEGRAVSFLVRPGYESEFINRFDALFGGDFLLVPHDEYIQKYLGPMGMDATHSRIHEFVGDFIAIAFGTRLMFYQHGDVPIRQYLSHHAGLTPDEMRVPLIIVSCDAQLCS